LVNKDDGQAMNRRVYVGNQIPIIADGDIEKQGFERKNSTKKFADVSSSTAAKHLDQQSINEAWRLTNVPINEDHRRYDLRPGL
jgi:hypothetical protein